MLTRLNLQNFTLARDVALDLHAGFTVLTGETGAGKSILLDGLSACLGERMDAQSVRFGADKADITAQFDLHKSTAARAWLSERELLDIDDEFEVRLRRVILAEGRSKAWINGTPTSLAELRELGDLLVQLHGQHSQQQLLKAEYPMHWLDTAAQLQSQADAVRTDYKEWQTLVKQQQRALLEREALLARQDVLNAQIEDVQPLLQYDYAELEQEHDRLSHFEGMMQDSAALLEGLDEGEDNLLSKLGSLLRRAQAQSGRAESLAAVATGLESAQTELQEAVSTLRQFADEQVLDPERFAQVDECLGEFHRLARKYRTTPESLKQDFESWSRELETLDGLADSDSLQLKVTQAEQTYQASALALDQARKKAVIPLIEQLTTQIKPLALPEARFEFEFAPVVASANGLSQIRLLFSANRGIPLQPLAKVASGGELSRIALVMQVMIAAYAEAPVLVFDEVDVGISGGTAEVVGRLLRNLGEQVQVLCITHQPQVAAQGHQHVLVEKQQGEQAASSLRELTQDQRISELARMSGGVEINEATLSHARSLLQSV
ncbi:DNA repair protein RecN [Aquirhabdus parva]|uniref:DNA repair protein RecN n=1 Tax=Aquirhabdus parva TaxID=2283318 RepID=A0A345P2E0_9GAMM|nr:DNA repair protein RecN [Aquirhabdus parva]AXI01449.1 DNA repair protein RecN [Aquirhabdus parva]